MELSELQKRWDEMSTEIKSQKKITDRVIEDIIKIKFSRKINNIIKYESLGAAVLFFSVLIIIWKIEVFDTLPLQICAIISISIMVTLPILSLTSIFRMHNLSMSKRTYKDTVIAYTKRRSFFLLIQRWAILFSGILMLTIIPVMLKIAKGKDFFQERSNNLLWFIPLGIILLFFFARWGYQCYATITEDAKSILKDLED